MSRLLDLGGDEEDRTPGLGIANAALSQLSYIPKNLQYFRIENGLFQAPSPTPTTHPTSNIN